jgi:predicted metal-dependent peptidase
MTNEHDKLAAAKLWLISDPAEGRQSAASPRGLPYLAHALYAQFPVPTRSVERLSCDEFWRLYVNPDWLASADVPEIGRELAHVTWHLLNDHTGRARSLNVDASTSAAWLLATDMTIGEMLRDEQSRPPGLPTPSEKGFTEGLAAEQYFAVETALPPGSRESEKKPEDDARPCECGSGADGLARPHELPPDVDLASVDVYQARAIRHHVAIEFKEHITTCGSHPAGAMRWINGVLEPTTPWEPILSAAVRRAISWASGRGDFTYSRPSRRGGSVPGVILPGQRRPLPRVSVVVDTSKSVDDELLSRALGEVEGVIKSLGMGEITVWSTDAEAVATTRVRNAADVKLAGGGGTDMRVGLAATEQERPRPDVVVVLTDGYTPWPEAPPAGASVVVGMLARAGYAAPPAAPDWAVQVDCILYQ